MNPKKTDHKKTKRALGFSLVELMAVIVIIGILSAVVGQQVISYLYQAKVTRVRADISVFKDSVEKFHIDTNQYPDESDGLYALVEQPAGITGWDVNGYLKGGMLSKDPWQNDYVYEYTGDPQRPFEIYSLGRDGRAGGQGEDADIYDYDIEEEQY